MAHPQNSYARLARQQVREANRVYSEVKANEPRQSMAELRQRHQRNIEKRAAAFDGLASGHSLAPFGLPGQVVEKKNAKSVVTATGTRWTRYELTGAE